jgi:hypothetical protein
MFKIINRLISAIKVIIIKNNKVSSADYNVKVHPEDFS